MSGIRYRIELAVHGVLIGGVVGALASGTPGVLVGLTLSAGYLGGVVFLLLVGCGVVGGMVGGAVGGFLAAVLKARHPRRTSTWKSRLLLASPVLIALAFFLAFAPFPFRRAAQPAFVPVIRGPGAIPAWSPPAGPPAYEPFVAPFRDFWKNHHRDAEPFVFSAIMIFMTAGPIGYGALIGGLAMRALTRADEGDEKGGDSRPFSPGVEPIKPSGPDEPDFA